MPRQHHHLLLLLLLSGSLLGGLFGGSLSSDAAPAVASAWFRPPPPVKTLEGPPELAAGAFAPVAGVVDERLDAGPYTYFAIRPSVGAPLWVVTMGQCPPPGTPVSVEVMGRQDSFHSRRLGRSFDELLFGIPTSATES